jgi:signal transduction histidine kinase/ActR/RegA family two-component response regulator
MLNSIRRRLRAKIVIVVLMTTLVALATSAAALLLYERQAYGSLLVNDASTQAQLLADVTAPALVFEDRAAAQETLDLISSRRAIVAAAVYTTSGEIFAKFSRAPDFAFPKFSSSGTTVSGTALSLFHPIVRNGEQIGTIYLRSDYETGARLRDYFLILLSVMVPSFIVATLVSLWLAGSVTNPLHALTDVARHVIDRRDFTRRAPRTTDDEIGVFVEAFNEMVGEVGRRAGALESSNRALQQEMEERKLAEIALRRADQRKDEFLATLAHELRNPLAPMVNALTLLDVPGVKPEIAKAAQGMIRRQLSQLVRLVDDLLDVSRINSGKLLIKKEPIDLRQVVESAVETVMPLVEQRRQTLRVDVPSSRVQVRGDMVRLSQVIANLLNNAAKFSEVGQEIALRVAVGEREAEVRIVDRGIGIAPEALGSIFEMFSQEESPSGLQAGLGVGLALARRLVELHAGSIVAESAGKGSGSVFTVRLPLDLATVRATREEARSSSRTGAKRILLVDDNADYANSMAILLQTEGHDVRVAGDAYEAIAVAREFKPEIGFLDLGLPGLSGYDLAKRLREQAETAGALLVAVSGWGQPSDRERSSEAGFALHMVKPVEFRDIESAIATLVPHS